MIVQRRIATLNDDTECATTVPDSRDDPHWQGWRGSVTVMAKTLMQGNAP
jgi:hypothetical protein